MNTPEYQKAYRLKNRAILIKRSKTFHQKRAKEHPSFINWQNMNLRCYYRSHNRYKYYGARGITVCPRWMTFSNFEHDFGYLKPIGDYTVDRIDNDKGYTLNNVRWLLRSKNKHHRGD